MTDQRDINREIPVNDKRRPFGLESFRGHWGLMTGASSGIGREYARRAAAAGLNLILVARRQGPLNDLARELEKTCNIQTRVFSSDLAQPGESIRIAETLKSEKIRIRFLCHAAGFGYWGSFTDGDSRLLTALVNLNTNTLIEMLLQFHDDLASHATSAAVIVSSRAGLHPIPTMAVYAAAKSFSQSLSQALHVEWEKEGIYVQALMPGAVDTSLAANHVLLAKTVLRKEEMQTPKEVVDASLRGFAHKKTQVMTGKGTAMQRFFPPFYQLDSFSGW